MIFNTKSNLNVIIFYLPIIGIFRVNLKHIQQKKIILKCHSWREVTHLGGEGVNGFVMIALASKWENKRVENYVKSFMNDPINPRLNDNFWGNTKLQFSFGWTFWFNTTELDMLTRSFLGPQKSILYFRFLASV